MYVIHETLNKLLSTFVSLLNICKYYNQLSAIGYKHTESSHHNHWVCEISPMKCFYRCMTCVFILPAILKQIYRYETLFTYV